MTFSWDFNTATIALIFLQALVLIRYLYKTESAAREAKKEAIAADDRAKKAHDHAEAAHIKLGGLAAELAIHREHVAKEYVDKDDLRELKDAIDGLRDRIDQVLSHWHAGGQTMTRFPLYIVLAIIALVLAIHFASAHEHADPKIQTWYKSQHNAQGQWCCDESDGHPYYGGYTINKDGSVTLDLAGGKKHTIPADMVITGPNPTGHAVWWHMETNGTHTDFCFAPGPLT